MMIHRFVIVLAVLGVTVVPAPAGPISRFIQKRKEQKQSSKNPTQPNNQMQPAPAQPVPAPVFQPQPAPLTQAQRVDQLVGLIKAGQDENQRTGAIVELGRYDLQAHPQIGPVLIEALRTDSSANVRGQAAETLGKVRPISAQAGYALQQAANSDSSTRVRWQAKTSLSQYQTSGYRPPIPGQPTTSEPPLAEPLPPQPAPVPTPRLAPAPAAKPIATRPVQAQPVSRPLPQTPLIPTVPPRLQTPPTTADDGPILPPPN